MSSANFSTRSTFRLDLNIALASQNVAGNYSTYNWSLVIVRTSTAYQSYYLSNTNSWSANIGGYGYSGNFSFDFRAYASLTLASGSVNIGHNPDGTAGFTSSGSVSASVIGNASTSQNDYPPTIPRASNPSFTNPTPIGSAVTINMNRASASFSHTVSYAFGTQSGTIATGVIDNVSWTPPLALLNEIPNSASGTGNITVSTYNGASLIGTTVTGITLTAPTSIIPDFTSITDSEATSVIATSIGKYVQNLTRLNLAITGAVGAYGSSISAYKIEVAGQAITAASGVTGVIGSSGTVTITGTVTDTRGRVAVKTKTITVIPYAPPTINSSAFQVRRSDALGTPNESGTTIRLDMILGASSLLNAGVEKNTLAYAIYTRLRGTTTWALKKSVIATGVSFNSYDMVSTFVVENAWEVRVDVGDNFNLVSIQGTVATAKIFMHWAAGGLGLGKFWERGAVDVLGQMYQNDGKAVLDSDSQSVLGTISPLWTSGKPDVILSDGITVVSAFVSHRDISIRPNSAVVMNRVNGLYYITSAQASDLLFTRLIPLPFAVTMYTWDWTAWGPLDGEYDTTTPTMITKNASGVVTLQGMCTPPNIITANTTIAVLPVGFRPSTDRMFPMMVNGVRRQMTITTAGVMSSPLDIPARAYVCFPNVIFHDAAQDLSWITPSAYLNGFSRYSPTQYPPGYALDSYGYTWYRGVMAYGTSTDNTPMFNTGSAYDSTVERHFAGLSQGGYGFAGTGKKTGNLRVKGPGTVGTGYISIDGIVHPSSSIDSNTIAGKFTMVNGEPNALYGTNGFENGWLNYDITNFTQASYYRRPDGLVLLEGFINVGNIGYFAFHMPPRHRPYRRIMFERPSNGTTGRLDITADGGVAPMAGSSTWFSLDGIAFQSAR